MHINIVAVLAASIAQFIFGAIWYMPLFGKLWGKIHGFVKVSPEEQKAMYKGMPPFLVVQFIFTIITTIVLAKLLHAYSGNWNPYCIALLVWLGFIVPTQVSAVIFGGTNPKWFIQKIIVMVFGALGCMILATFVLGLF
jgi:hypothetical protein